MNISRLITNAFLPNLPITYEGGDNKNDCYSSALASAVYIELVDSNLHPIDLLYPLRLLLFVEFFRPLFLFLTPVFPIETTSLNQGITN
jgi:hypothetical protein